MKHRLNFRGRNCLVVFLFLFALSPVAQATRSDAAKEARWAEQIQDSLLDGEAIWLDDGHGHEFLGILTEGHEDQSTAVILMHGIGVHPNWPDVIFPLRQSLLERGTTSLSIQMPILENAATEADYVPLFAEVAQRIDAALGVLGEKGFREVILVGHSLGASMAVHYLAHEDDVPIASLIVIGMNPGLTGSENIEALKKIHVPLLDLYGAEDLEPVLNSAKRRAAAGRQGAGDDYRQIRVDKANHFFQGRETALVRHVHDWLEKLAN